MGAISWQPDLEALEAVSRNPGALEVCLHMAALRRNGGLEPFLEHVRDDGDFDQTTKAQLAELAGDESFLLAVEDYVHRTALLN